LDDLCDTYGSVAVRDGNQLHDGRLYPYTAGYRDRRGAAQSNPGSKTGLTFVDKDKAGHKCNRMIADLTSGGTK
jgi:hypothetical protein